MTLLAILLYQILALPAGIAASVYLLIFRPGEALERFGGGPRRPRDPRHGNIWIHAASLGEFEAARPLIDAWTDGGDGSRLLLSCTNAVARRRSAERIPAGARVRLAPLDLWPFVGRALARERPSCMIFLETEIWPAWILAASLRSVPIAFVSARISARNLGRYRALRPLLRPFLRRIRVIGCRTEEDRARWISIGAPADRCVVWGNTKYDAGVDPGAHSLGPGDSGDAAFILVAGSVRRGEEAILDAFMRLRAPAARHAGTVVVGARGGAAREIRLILAPRHVRDIARWEDACLRRGLGCRRLSLTGIAPEGGPSERLLEVLRTRDMGMPAVLIVDQLGVLTRLYRAADAAFVGGTWIPIGGHNLFEPAREGVPVLFGPSIEGVRDVAEALLTRGGGIQVVDATALADAVHSMMMDPAEQRRIGHAARAAAESVAGARDRTLIGLREVGFLAAANGRNPSPPSTRDGAGGRP